MGNVIVRLVVSSLGESLGYEVVTEVVLSDRMLGGKVFLTCGKLEGYPHEGSLTSDGEAEICSYNSRSCGNGYGKFEISGLGGSMVS